MFGQEFDSPHLHIALRIPLLAGEEGFELDGKPVPS